MWIPEVELPCLPEPATNPLDVESCDFFQYTPPPHTHFFTAQWGHWKFRHGEHITAKEANPPIASPLLPWLIKGNRWTSGTHHEFTEHGIQLLHRGHGQGGLHRLKCKVAIIPKPICDFWVVIVSETAKDKWNPPSTSLPWGHGWILSYFLILLNSVKRRHDKVEYDSQKTLKNQTNSKESSLSFW